MHTNLLSQATVDFVKSFFSIQPKVAIVLGSGVKALEGLDEERQLEYSDIPDFPQSTVAGHSGVISIGKYNNVPVAVLRGRFHKYEGHIWKNVIAPVALMKEMGVSHLILTNAAGGVNRTYIPGELMLMEDHINFHLMTSEERKALYEAFDERRNIEIYDPELKKLAKKLALENKVVLHQGVYASLPGPAYETRAEILMMRTINADAVGMSTVPEALWAKALNMKTLGISCITNSTYFAAAMSETSHEEVVTVAKQASENIDILLKAILRNLF